MASSNEPVFRSRIYSSLNELEFISRIKWHRRKWSCWIITWSSWLSRIKPGINLANSMIFWIIAVNFSAQSSHNSPWPMLLYCRMRDMSCKCIKRTIHYYIQWKIANWIVLWGGKECSWLTCGFLNISCTTSNFKFVFACASANVLMRTSLMSPSAVCEKKKNNKIENRRICMNKKLHFCLLSMHKKQQ